MNRTQREIAHSMFQSQPDAVIELSPAVVAEMRRVAERAELLRGMFTVPEPAHEVELSPELEQQRRTVLGEVDRVVRERDIAVAALKRIRELSAYQVHSAGRLMREIATDALNEMEGR